MSSKRTIERGEGQRPNPSRSLAHSATRASKRFGAIMADPPWPYRSSRAIVGNGGRGSQRGWVANIIQVSATTHYRTMPLGEIMALPVGEVAAEDSHLYL